MSSLSLEVMGHYLVSNGFITTYIYINHHVVDIARDHHRQCAVLEIPRVGSCTITCSVSLTETLAATVAIIPNDFISVEFQPRRKCPS